MGRKKAEKTPEVEKQNEPDAQPDKVNTFQMFARKPGRAVVMTQEASAMGDESAKKSKPKPSGRTANAIWKIRKEENE